MLDLSFSLGFIINNRLYILKFTIESRDIVKKIVLITILCLTAIYFQFYYQVNDNDDTLQSAVASSSANAQHENDLKLVATSHYPKDNPASNEPLLRWQKDLTAVYFELELFDHEPANLSDNELSSEHLYYTATIYTNAVQLDLRQIAPEALGKKPLYWRVRAMDFDHEPSSKFSDLEILYANNTPSPMQSPIPNAQYNQHIGTTILYPAYDFIPNANATQFEIEVLDAPPENPRGIAPSVHRIFSQVINSNELYDPYPRIGTYYWRVRGLDDNGNPVGVYSDVQKFRNEPSDNWKIAILGDSISHGGGHLSFGPEDWEYSYAYYLDFPVINLSHSGDTSSTMVERFDSDVLPFHPKYLLIMCGTNSLRAGVPAESVIADIQTIQQKCYDNNITPILLTLATINPHNIKKVFDEDTSDDWLENLNAVNRYIRTQPHIDTAATLNSPGILPTHYAMDGLHGDIPAKKLYAKAINENISQFLNK